MRRAVTRLGESRPRGGFAPRLDPARGIATVDVGGLIPTLWSSYIQQSGEFVLVLRQVAHVESIAEGLR
jgi:hypothetical protein